MPKPTSTHLYGGAERMHSTSFSECTLPILFLSTLGILRIVQEGSLIDPAGLCLMALSGILYWKLRE